jgi:hypothetical protein
MLKLIILTLIIFIYQQDVILATHIVGGEMTYRCLGNDEYEVNLKIYRDCDSGIPWFDNSAAIGVFDAQTNYYVLTVAIPLNTASNDTISADYPDSCINNICVHYTVYSQVVRLPPNNTGYVFVHQRCCRAIDLVNIIDPSNTGMTITAELTPAAMLSCNSSPQFNRETPLIVSTNDTLSINLGATDIDGDSLVYELYASLDGGTTSTPIPNPPSSPPYNTVSFQVPFYFSSNPLGVNALFDWDTSTGELTILPSNIGTYAIGLSVLEYNSAGVLLSKIYRDVVIHSRPSPCSPITSVDEIAKEKPLIQLFPNPIKDNIQIEVNHTEKMTLRIYSVDGRQVLANKVFNQQTTINLSELPKGVYFMEFQSRSNRTIKKVIKE